MGGPGVDVAVIAARAPSLTLDQVMAMAEVRRAWVDDLYGAGGARERALRAAEAAGLEEELESAVNDVFDSMGDEELADLHASDAVFEAVLAAFTAPLAGSGEYRRQDCDLLLRPWVAVLGGSAP